MSVPPPYGRCVAQDPPSFLELASTRAFLSGLRRLSLEDAAEMQPTAAQRRLSEAVALVLRGARQLRGLDTIDDAVAWLDERLADEQLPDFRRPASRLDANGWTLLERGDVPLPWAALRQAIRVIQLVDDSPPGYAMSVRWPASARARDALAALTADLPSALDRLRGRMSEPLPEAVLDLEVISAVLPGSTGSSYQMFSATGIRAIDAVVLEQLGPFVSPLSHAEIRDRDGVWHLVVDGSASHLQEGPDPHLERTRRIFEPLDSRPAGTRAQFEGDLERVLRESIGDDERALAAARDRAEQYLAGAAASDSRSGAILRRVRDRAPLTANAQAQSFEAVIRDDLLPAAGVTVTPRDVGL
jgi:hypothetical protein